MVEPMTQLLPYAQVFHLPISTQALVSSSLVLRTFSARGAADLSIILEPMIATAKTLTATIDIVKQSTAAKKLR